eukprot:20730-Heterocapsa_arctica.AAC.1
MFFRAALPGFSSSCSQALVLCHRTDVGETDGCFITDSASVRVVNEALDEARSQGFHFPFCMRGGGMFLSLVTTACPD